MKSKLKVNFSSALAASLSVLLVVPFALAIAILITLPILMYWAATLNILHEWFLLSLGIPMLSIPHLMGILLIAKLLLYTGASYHPSKDKDLDSETWRLLGVEITMPIVALCVGYIVKCFM